MTRAHYASIFGPTTGDMVRLGDTGLVIEVERDPAIYGDECKFGGGKVLRDGMGQAAGVPEKDALDCVLTNAVIKPLLLLLRTVKSKKKYLVDCRLHWHLQGRHRYQRRPDCRDWKSR